MLRWTSFETNLGKMPENPLYWEWATSGTNAAVARMQTYCLKKSIIDCIDMSAANQKDIQAITMGTTTFLKMTSDYLHNGDLGE